MKEQISELNIRKIMDSAAGKAKRIEQDLIKDIAVIGIGIRFPGADNVDEFWNNIAHKRDCIGELSDIRKNDVRAYMECKESDKEIVFRKGAYLDDISHFDYSAFHIAPKEAELMDPNQRVFLETAWQAIEDAGYTERIKGSLTGVYAGYSGSALDSYAAIISEYDQGVLDIAFAANLPSVLAGRLSYLLDLKGGSMVIDTACSSSLVAVHNACKAIQHRECEMAIAGGCKITLFPLEHQGKIGIESSDGKTHTFDNQSDGTGEGEGAAAILLKPYEKAKKDGDYIYAVIKGSAVNQDGHSIGLTAPNGQAQQEVIRKAWKDAGVPPDTISYVEVHGTGTSLGDPIEVDALSKAFSSQTSRKQFCAVSAVKTNLGHQDTVSGIAGLVKAILALNNKKLPPFAHFNTPNQKIDFTASPVYICDRLMDWEVDGVRRCGVSSFGLNGTNCHMVLEEALYNPCGAEKEGLKNPCYHALLLSAKNKEFMKQTLQREREFLAEQTHIQLEEFLYSHHTGKIHLPWRLAIVFNEVKDLCEKIDKLLYLDMQAIEDTFFQTAEEKTDRIEYLREWNQDKEKILELSRRYVEGYRVDWDKYYQSSAVKRCRIPLYPLDRKYCWVKNRQQADQKLLGMKTADYQGICIYQRTFQVKDHWVLKEHSINGKNLFPGASLIEMAAELGYQLYPGGIVCLQKFMLLEPFFVDRQEKKTVQVIAEKKDGYYAVSILGKGTEDSWVKYAECQLYREEMLEREKLEINWERDDDVENIKISNTERFVDAGDRWNNINSVKIEENDCFVQLKLAERYEDEARYYYMHPALLDNGINAALHLESDGNFLPFYFEKIYIAGTLGNQIQSSIHMVSRDKEQGLLSYRIKMADRQGNVKVFIEDYVARRMDKNSLEKRDSAMFHEVKWQAQEQLELTEKNAGSDVILLKDETELGRKVKMAFEQAGYSVKTCLMAEGKIESRLQGLLMNQKPFSRINLVLAVPDSRENTEIDNADQIQQEFMEQIHWIKLLMREYINLKFRCFVVTESACSVMENEKGGNLIGAMLAAFFQVVNQESSNMTGKCLDFDSNTSLQYLVSELEQGEGDKEDSFIAYRRNVRYKQIIKDVPVNHFSDKQTVIEKDGVAIVAGGIGGIGLEICKRIADLQNGTICIIGKTPLEENKSDKNVKQKLKTLTGFGAKVVYYSCDIAEKEALEQLFQNIAEKFGKVQLVLNMTGVSGNGYVQYKQDSEMVNVIGPKVKGTSNLYELCKKHQIGTLLLWSSISSFLGGPGQSDYAAANAYMDALAMNQREVGTKIISVDWSRWENIGMAKGIEGRDELFYPVTGEEGVKAFEKILAYKGARLVVGRINKEHAYFRKHFSKEMNKIRLDSSHELQDAQEAVRLTGRKDKNYTKLEKQLALIWGQTLGLTEIDVYDSIYNQGGDSILATRIVNAAKEKYHITISISEIFKYASIDKLANYLEQKEVAASEVKEIKENAQTIRTESQYYPLSVEQKRIYFLHQLSELKTVYNLPFHTVLPKMLKPDYLHKAIEILGERHLVLRTVFLSRNGVIMQKVLDRLDLEIECVKLQDEDQDRALELLFQRENEFIFDLSKPLIRVMLIELNDQSCCLYLNLHHLITDGWSTRILLQELYQIYTCQEQGKEVTLQELPLTYFDWIQERENWLQTGQAKEMEQYWLKELEAPLPVLELPSDFKRPRVQQYQGNYVLGFLDEEVTRKVKKLAEFSHTTLHVVMMSVYFVLLQKLTGNKDIIVGFPMTLRSGRELEQVVGLFVNTLCVRAELNPEDTFSAFIKYIKEKSYQAYEHNQYPFDELVMKINPERDLSRTPIFSTFFQFYDDIPQERAGISLYDFSLYCKHAGERIELRAEYSTGLFRKETAEKYLTYFCRLLDQVLDQTEAKLKDLSLMSTEEYHQVTCGFNQTEAAYNKEATLADLLSWDIKRAGNQIAVRTLDSQATYQQLENDSNQLARCLVDRGVQKGQVIPICASRSVEMLIGIYGIIKAGAAYLPVSEELPEARIEYMLNDCKAGIIVLSKKEKEKFFGYSCIYLEEFRNLPKPTEPMVYEAVTPDDLAYVIYTSGSTGNPKGVKVKHQSVINRINWMNKQFPIKADDVIMQKTTYAFDVSVWEIFWWAYSGASVYLSEPGDEKRPEELVNKIEQFGVTVIHFVPTMFCMFLDYVAHFKVIEKLKSLRYIFLSGEELPADYVNRFYGLTNGILETKLVNLYGPTEATVDVTYFECDRNTDYEHIPIGKPIDNTYLYILDKERKVQPIGVSGELYIAGDGVAEGYLNKPELTKERFVDNPFQTSRKMYKTGDLCRWEEDGNIQYLGRLDHQVKIRGCRIERGEIEKVLLQYENIKDAVVIDKMGKDRIMFLCAYVVSDKEPKTDEIKAFLRKYLPEYMVPSYIVVRKEFPMLPNGKVNLAKLKKIDIYEKPAKIKKPINQTENQIHTLWAEVLEQNPENISTDDNFFDIGGNSIRLMSLCMALNVNGWNTVTVAQLFSYPTIHAMALFLDGIKNVADTGKKEYKKEEIIEVKQENAIQAETDIAVIGLSARFPEAGDYHAFWEELQNGKDFITDIPKERKRDVINYFESKNEPVEKLAWKKLSYLRHIDQFDYSFFHISPKEAALMDPNQRIFLETAYEAIEDAGYGGDSLYGSNTGVYVGFSGDALYKNFIPEVSKEAASMALAGNIDSMLPSRISYFMNFHGPAVMVNTACSSSLAAIHYACKALQENECGTALVGSVKLCLLPVENSFSFGIESSTARTCSFDEYSDGTGGGEGAAAVLLKPLSQAVKDGDSIYAVIKGSSLNQDGRSVGIVAPNPEAQKQVILDAWRASGVDPETISYIEAHGSGTKLGDPIEIEGITAAFRQYTNRKQFCAVSSVKSNLGHLDHAAGMAGFVKAVLSVYYGKLVPSLHFSEPNRQIPFRKSPVYINDRLKDWKCDGQKRRCGVSSMGLSGTNCHIVLEQAPELNKIDKIETKPFIFTMAAKSKNSLQRLLNTYIQYLEQKEVELQNVCYTQALGRGHYQYRIACVVNSQQQLLEKLKAFVEAGLGKDGTEGFYREYRGVYGQGNDKGSYTKQELEDITREAGRLVEQVRQEDMSKEDDLETLCRLYVQGAAVDWNGFYEGIDAKRISLPCYAFERNRCWVEAYTKKAGYYKEDNEVYYQTKWKKQELPEKNDRAKRLAVIMRPSDLEMELGDILDKYSDCTVRMILGGQYQKISENEYYIRSVAEDFQKILEEHKLDKVILSMALSLEREDGDTESLEKYRAYLTKNLFVLNQALKKSAVQAEVILLSRCSTRVEGTEAIIYPECSVLEAFGKVMPLENPAIRARFIDVDDNTELNLVAGEICSERKWFKTVYRNQNRYCAFLHEVEKPEKAEQRIREGDVYVITGGLGDLGLETALNLVTEHQVTVVLLGRSAFPEKCRWNNILIEGKDDALCHKVKMLQKMQYGRGKVIIRQADVADSMQIRGILKGIYEEYHRIDGIFHYAGVNSGQTGKLLWEQRLSDFEEELKAKVKGTLILYEEAERYNPQFLIAFSSPVSLIGGVGAGSYTASNLFLDAFADSTVNRTFKLQTIAWAPWARTAEKLGEYFKSKKQLFKIIQTEQMLHVLETMIASHETSVIFGEINFECELFQIYNQLPFRLSSTLERKLKTETRGHERKRQIRAKGRSENDYTETELEVVQYFGKMLGYDEINIHDNYFELGGDSVSGAKIVNSLNETRNGILNTTDLFTNLTVYEFAKRIEEKMQVEDAKTGYSTLEVQEEQNESILELSYAQRRIYIQCSMMDCKLSYNIPVCYDIEGSISIDKLETAMNQMIARHQIFRTTFEIRESGPVQVIHDHYRLQFERISCKEEEADETVLSLVQPFQLDKLPLVRAAVVEISSDRHLLFLDQHHIISDGFSLNLVMEELLFAYLDKELPKPVQYSSFTKWQNAMRQTARYEEQKNFWETMLKGLMPKTALPYDYSDKLEQAFEGGTYRKQLGEELTGQVLRLAVQLRTSDYIFLLAAFYVLLYKNTGSRDITILTPVLGRGKKEFEYVMGNCINLLPLRNYPKAEISFAEFLQDVRDRSLSCFGNENVQFDDILGLPEVDQRVNMFSQFNIMFVKNDVEKLKGQVKEMTIKEHNIPNKTAKYDLSLEVKSAKNIGLAFEYASSRFKPEIIEKLALQYIDIIRQVAASPDMKIADIQRLKQDNSKKKKKLISLLENLKNDISDMGGKDA